MINAWPTKGTRDAQFIRSSLLRNKSILSMHPHFRVSALPASEWYMFCALPVTGGWTEKRLQETDGLAGLESQPWMNGSFIGKTLSGAHSFVTAASSSTRQRFLDGLCWKLRKGTYLWQKRPQKTRMFVWLLEFLCCLPNIPSIIMPAIVHCT